jgi:hypothetical protein
MALISQVTELGKRAAERVLAMGGLERVAADEEAKCKMRLNWVAFRGLSATAPPTAVEVSREDLFNLPGMD